jgi:1-aminocyclopropane-1-carboxylate deaminase
MSLEIFNKPAQAPIEFVDTFPDNLKLYIKREDLIHPLISGNKWRKLKYNIIDAHHNGYSRILTFGGAFSNHIFATAAAGAACGIDTIGIIRGEILEPLNPTLTQAAAWGMKLVPVTRQEFKRKTNDEFLSALREIYGEFYLIPEGGSNTLALKGCAEMADVSDKFDYWCLGCGTGGTLAGLVSGLKNQEKVLGFPALKGSQFLVDDIKTLLEKANIHPSSAWELVHDYHFGGFAKISKELIAFIQEFKKNYGIILDPIYTAKMMFGVIHMIQEGKFPANSRILAVHTGGLQGVIGIEEKYGIKIK